MKNQIDSLQVPLHTVRDGGSYNMFLQMLTVMYLMAEEIRVLKKQVRKMSSELMNESTLEPATVKEGFCRKCSIKISDEYVSLRSKTIADLCYSCADEDI